MEWSKDAQTKLGYFQSYGIHKLKRIHWLDLCNLESRSDNPKINLSENQIWLHCVCELASRWRGYKCQNIQVPVGKQPHQNGRWGVKTFACLSEKYAAAFIMKDLWKHIYKSRWAKYLHTYIPTHQSEGHLLEY